MMTLKDFIAKKLNINNKVSYKYMIPSAKAEQINRTELLNTFVAVIDEATEKCSIFFIGRTNNPLARINEADLNSYTKIYPIYKNDSFELIEWLRDRIVMRYEEVINCTNINDGNSGPIEKDDCNMIFVAVKF